MCIVTLLLARADCGHRVLRRERRRKGTDRCVCGMRLVCVEASDESSAQEPRAGGKRRAVSESMRLRLRALLTCICTGWYDLAWCRDYCG